VAGIEHHCLDVVVDPYRPVHVGLDVGVEGIVRMVRLGQRDQLPPVGDTEVGRDEDGVRRSTADPGSGVGRSAVE